ncbi:MAG: beta-lactamase family protein [Saprospirales bacterium]|nr:beta-lactamase family protein [Saprospirales bacterium]
MRLAQEGFLDLDSSLVAYLNMDPIDPAIRNITLRRCLNHTSGLPRYPPGFGEIEYSAQDPYAAYSKEELRAFLEAYRLPNGSPCPYSFSNMNYGFLELAVEARMGRPFEEIMQEELLAPLDLGHTYFTLPVPDESAIAQGYNAASRPTPLWHPASHQGAFGLKSNMADLLKWMQLLLAPPPAWEPIFSELYRQPIPTGIRKNTYVALGWHVVYPKKKRFRILVHTGSTSGYMAYMALVPETKTGVVILANSPYGARGLGMLVLGMLNDNWKKHE